jgi:signal transduction histidine kinase
MAVRKPRLPSRYLLILLAVFTLGLASALVWLGWRLVRQDRDLEGQRVAEHLDRAAVAVSAELERLLARVEALLDGLAAAAPGPRRVVLARTGDSLPPGALLVDLDSAALHAAPARRLLYDPSLIPTPEIPDPAFREGERLEHRERNLTAAAAAYRELAGSAQLSRRAGALLRLGRTQRKAGGGQLEQALDTYARLARLDSLSVEGRPAALVAGHARIELLQQLSRPDEALVEARALLNSLFEGRWRLARGGFEFYSAELLTRLGEQGGGDSIAGAQRAGWLLTRAVDSLWREGASAGAAGARRRILAVDGANVLAVGSGRGGARLVFLATAEHLKAAWLPELGPLLVREGVWLELSGPAGALFPAQDAPGTAPGIVRGPELTRLPWTLSLGSRDPTRLSGDLAARRRILLAGLVVASLLGLLGTYAVARAVNRELEVARVQSDFVAAVSHEFRTPLTSLRQLSELLVSGRVPGEERRQAYYELMRRESLRLQRLVEGLLDFGRMEAGAHEVRLERVEAGELVRTVVREFQEDSAGEERRIELAACADACPIQADREALGRALWNLLDNAVKYAPGSDPVRVSLTRSNGRVGIRVADRGPGIPAEEQARVFEKFIRGQHARAAGIRGTGLGLAMVREIARAHHGEVRLESAPGQGSSFILTLPVREEPA